jgi:hypothetical protein
MTKRERSASLTFSTRCRGNAANPVVTRRRATHKLTWPPKHAVEIHTQRQLLTTSNPAVATSPQRPHLC